MKTIDLDLIDYAESYVVQERLAAEVFAGSAPETLLLLEHPPVYTIGSSGRDENILDPCLEVIRINRGGDATFHGPGQLVGYPIVDLGRRGRDLHRYLRFLEEILISLAVDSGADAYRVPGRTGVWTDRGKLASIGVGVRHWVTMHGFALNVAGDLAGFARINPCGMAGCPLTSLEQEVGDKVPMGEVKERLSTRFSQMVEERLPVLEKGVSTAGGGSSPLR